MLSVILFVAQTKLDRHQVLMHTTRAHTLVTFSLWLSFSSLKPLMKIVESPEDTVAYWAVRTIAGLSMIRSMSYNRNLFYWSL